MIMEGSSTTAKDMRFEDGQFELRSWMKTRISRVESLNNIFGGANDFPKKSVEHMEKEG